MTSRRSPPQPSVSKSKQLEHLPQRYRRAKPPLAAGDDLCSGAARGLTHGSRPSTEVAPIGLARPSRHCDGRSSCRAVRRADRKSATAATAEVTSRTAVKPHGEFFSVINTVINDTTAIKVAKIGSESIPLAWSRATPSSFGRRPSPPHTPSCKTAPAAQQQHSRRGHLLDRPGPLRWRRARGAAAASVQVRLQPHKLSITRIEVMQRQDGCEGRGAAPGAACGELQRRTSSSSTALQRITEQTAFLHEHASATAGKRLQPSRPFADQGRHPPARSTRAMAEHGLGDRPAPVRLARRPRPG